MGQSELEEVFGRETFSPCDALDRVRGVVGLGGSVGDVKHTIGIVNGKIIASRTIERSFGQIRISLKERFWTEYVVSRVKHLH